MSPKTSLALQCLISFLISMILLLGLQSHQTHRTTEKAIDLLGERAGLLQVGPPEASEVILQEMSEGLLQQGHSTVVYLVGIGLLALLWGMIWQNASQKVGAAPAEPSTSGKKESKKPEKPSQEAGIQVLALLQRKGRLIDFLQEDLSEFEDDQIGAAVRSVHEGCREALQEIAEFQPVFDQSEGDEVAIEAGFDASAIRLTGNVRGEPPFRGTLQHRGWKVERFELPRKTSDKADPNVVAPAEVEV